MLLEEPDDGKGEEGGHESRPLLPDVAAIDDGAHDAGVGRGSTDAELLELGRQRRLREARRGIGAVPIGLQRRHIDGLALPQHGQHPLALVVGVFLAGVLVGCLEAREECHRARRRELDITAVSGPRADAHSRRSDASVCHLRGHGALPDEVVEGELIGTEFALDLARRTEDVTRRSDRLVGLLGVLDLAVIATRGLSDVVGTVEFGRLAAGCRDGLLRQRRGVGAHVGDVSAFVEPLCHAHRALGIPAEATRCLLLEGRGHEGRGWAALAGLLGDGAHRVVDTHECRGQGGRTRLVEDEGVLRGQLAPIIEVLACCQPLAVDGQESSGEGTGIEYGR